MTNIHAIALGGALLVASLAQAQPQEKRVVVGRLGDGDSRVVEQSESHTFEFSLKDGRPRVVIDGQEIPADRVQTENGRIVIITPDGERRVTELRLRLPEPLMGGDLRAMLVPGGLPGGEALPTAPPKVVLGVTTRATLPALEKHLRLEPGTTVMVASVLEGLPAHAAGLEPDDVIVAVDGQEATSPERLRELLASRDPGDAVVLRLVQRGREREVSIALEAFDAERMASARRIGEPELRITELPGLDGQFMIPGLESGLWRDVVIDGERNTFFVPGMPALPAAPGTAPPDGRSDTEVRAMEQRLRELEDRLKALDRLLERLDAAEAGKSGG